MEQLFCLILEATDDIAAQLDNGWTLTVPEIFIWSAWKEFDLLHLIPSGWEFTSWGIPSWLVLIIIPGREAKHSLAGCVFPTQPESWSWQRSTSGRQHTMGLSGCTYYVCRACPPWLSVQQLIGMGQTVAAKNKTVQKSCKTKMSDSSLRCETKPASSVSCQEQGKTWETNPWELPCLFA